MHAPPMGLAKRLRTAGDCSLNCFKRSSAAPSNEIDHRLNAVIGHHQQLLVMPAVVTHASSRTIRCAATNDANKSMKGCNFLGFT